MDEHGTGTILYLALFVTLAIAALTFVLAFFLRRGMAPKP